MKVEKRIILLTEAEISEIYEIPQFNNQERKYFFDLSQSDFNLLKQYANIKTRVFFILQLGYFRASKQFFTFSLEDVSIKKDVTFIINTYFKTAKKALKGQLSRDYNSKQKAVILSLHDYHDWSSKYISQVKQHLAELVKYFPKGHDTLRELFCYFDNNRIVIPSYRTLQDLFTATFSAEEIRLKAIVLSMPKGIQRLLKRLIKHHNGLSQLNVIKLDQKNFQCSAIRIELEKVQKIAKLYSFSKKFIPKLMLSKNAVHYYAEIIDQYKASKIRKSDEPQQWLYLICFVHYRYQQLMDNLITSFIYHVRAIIEAGRVYANEQFLSHTSSIVMEFPKLAAFLKWFPSKESKPSTTYDELSKEGYKILPKKQFSIMAEFISGQSFDKEAARWEYFEKSSRLLSLYLRPILLAVDFDFYEKDSKIMKLINVLQNHYSKGKSPSTLNLCVDEELYVEENMLGVLKNNTDDEQLNPYRYEFYVYKKMYHQLNRGRLFCNNSIMYCDVDHDLIPDELVDNAEEITKKFGYPKIPVYCDERLDAALKDLDAAWFKTNKNIKTGKNKDIKIEKDKEGNVTWNLLYDAANDNEDSFFNGLEQIDIADLLKFIGDKVNMWSAFTPKISRYTKQKKPDVLTINACLLSEAFGFGIQKMADISDINFNTLESTRENFLREETLSAANDVISDFIYSLPIFKEWNLMDDLTIADADGQKVETSRHTIQSRYSSKYFGTDKGISIYTLVANHVPVNAKNIGPNEYEGHNLYDIIYNNTSEIPIDKVTGDNHSLNRLNFVALDSIDVDYIPSIKDIKGEAEKLYSPKDPENYIGLLKPKEKINKLRITSQRRGIMRVLLSLIMQENTQSVIVRKLSSHDRYARLRAALLEYNRIFKSIHVLNLINDLNLRKVIKSARNRTEAYHQLQALIRKVYGGVFKGRKIVDNKTRTQAGRLVANCIIAHNALLLNNLYEKIVQKRGVEVARKIFARISPVAWSYISFTGRYNFKTGSKYFDIESMLKALEEKLAKIQ